MKNYISENLDYLVRQERLSKDEFGTNFDLNRGSISNYIYKKAFPKIETIQRICAHFEITIDDFINKDLSKGDIYAIKKGELLQSNEPKSEPYIISPNYVQNLEKTIIDKEKIINMLEEKLSLHEKNNTA